jgi:glutamine synthetase
VIVSVEVKYPGQPCSSREIMDRIIDEMTEFTWQSTRAEASARILDSIESEERIEITVRDPEGNLVGIAVCLGEDDDHVGVVLGVQWRFVLSEARGAVGVAIQREIIKVARLAGVKIIAYTKRVSEGRFEINYQKLKEKPHG